MASQATLWDWADPQPALKRSRLRPYQATAVEAILDGFNHHRTGLVVAPTGTGKTVIFAELIRRWFEQPNAPRALVLAEQRQILRQAQAKIEAWTGRLGDVALEQGGESACRERIVCASRQSLAIDMRLERLAKDPPGLIIVDEAHHAGKRKGQYEKILERFPKANVVGLTATPDRGDKLALEVRFETLFYKLEIGEAQAGGWLVDARTPTLKNWDALDISRIRKHHGELDEASLEKLLAEVVKDQARAGLEEVSRYKSIWFCGRVETAHALAACIRAETGDDHCAYAVDGEMDDDQKDELLDGFKKGQFQHLVNVGIATEGFDCPDAVAAVLTRPYLSRGRFTQAFGRVLRPLDGLVDPFDTAPERRGAIAGSPKPWALVVNYRYIKGKHSLVCPEDVLGGKYPDEVKECAAGMREQDPTLTVGESLEKASEQADRSAKEAERARKAKLAAEAQAKARAEWTTYDPFEGRPYFDENGEPFTPIAIEPPEPITPGQRKYLKYGFKVPEHEIPKTKKAAGRMIGELKKQKEGTF